MAFIISPKIMIYFGLLAVFFGIYAGMGGWDYLIIRIVRYNARLVPGTKTWEMWRDVPIPIYLKFHIFSIETSDEDIKNGKNIRVKEKGPYTYREELQKINVTVLNGTEEFVEYQMTRNYHFEPGMSIGSDLDKITILNMPYVAFAHLASDFIGEDDPTILNILDDGLKKKGEKFTRTETVRDLIFDGMNAQPYLDLFNEPMISGALKALDIQIPTSLEDGKFALLYGKNGSDDGTFVISRGVNDMNEFGRIQSWNGNDKLGFWKGSCNDINGTDGMIHPPFISKTTILQSFTPQLCRSLTFKFKEEVKIKDLKLLRFDSLTEDLKGKSNKDLSCFCLKEKEDQCLPDGLLDIAPCTYGVSILVSKPHFLDVDNSVKLVEGMKPEMEKHNSFFDIHALTGANVRVRNRIQFNMELKPWPLATFSNVSQSIVPLVWVEEGGDIGSVKFYLHFLSSSIVFWSNNKWLIFLTGFGLTLLGIYLKWNKNRSRMKGALLE